MYSDPLTGYPLLQPTADDAVVQAKQNLQTEQIAGKVIIVGDSSSLHGLKPNKMNENGQLSFINMGTLASLTLVGYCEMAIQAMQSDNKPRAILLAILPQTLQTDLSKAKQMQHLGRFLVAYKHTNNGIYTVAPREYLDWLAHKHRFNLFPEQFGGSYKHFSKLLEDTLGFFPEEKQHINTNTPLGNLNVSDMSIAALERLTMVSSAESIPVLLALSPKPETAVTEAYRNSAHSITNEIKRRFPTITILPNAGEVWEARWFGTRNHLNRQGADLYSIQVTNQIETIYPTLTPESNQPQTSFNQ